MLQNILSLLSKLKFFTSAFISKNAFAQPLSAEEEKELLTAYKAGDEKAKEKLVRHNMRLVAHIAKKFAANNEIDDLICIGAIGLVKGISSYEMTKSTALSTYLARCIENEILMVLRQTKRYKNTVYLYEPVGIDSEGNEYTLMDTLSQKDETLFVQVENSIIAEKLDEILRETLTEREYTIIKYRFGLQNAPVLTQLQTSQRLGISRSYISRIESKALSKLKEALKDKDFY
ncbi:MAG: RNA polymerase sporulation sigma factor SigK [Clostridia bacterium]|nr:RNA polymerase sporulation sigma factor SigK [Clostridia bacterium]